MKAIYVFTIILIFSMVSPNVFACGGENESAGSETGNASSDTPSVTSAAPPISFLPIADLGAPLNAVQCSHNIVDELLERSKRPGQVDKDFQKLTRNAQKYSSKQIEKDKKIDALIAYLKLLRLLYTGTKAERDKVVGTYYLLMLVITQP